MNKYIFSSLLVSLTLIGLFLLGGCANIIKNFQEPEEYPPLKLMDDVPWQDYQKMNFTIYDGEEKVGTMEIEVKKVENSTEYEVTKVKKTGDKEVRSNAVIQKNTLMPISSFYHEKSDKDNVEISTTYTEKWNVKTMMSDDVNIQNIDLPEAYYDNESLLVILAALPYEEIVDFQLNNAIPLTTRIESLSGKNKGKEQIKVPYGEAECYKVKLGKLNFWYSNDNDRVLYQYKDGDTVFKLTDIINEENQ